MFSRNPNATPIWLLMIFSVVSYFAWPRIKRFVSIYTDEEENQKFFSMILIIMVMAIVVTLSVIIFP